MLAGKLNRIVVFEFYFLPDTKMNANLTNDRRRGFVGSREPVQHLEELQQRQKC